MLFIFALLLAIASFVAWLKLSQALIKTVAGIVGLFWLVVAVIQCITVIPAGSVGVIDFFGTVSKETLNAGINVVNPLANIIKFSIKTQEIKETMQVPSKEGLNVQLEISVLFHLNPEEAANVYKGVASDYVNVLLVPQIRSVTRGVTSSYEAKALYTSEREVIANMIKEELIKIVSKRGITVETTPLRSVTLPPNISSAIENKLKAEQESQQMQFVLLKETQEAERKRIEAKGIADFQNIVMQGISENLLKWKGIEATEKLASSPNAKIIVIGGKDGLPLILDGK